MRVVIINYSEVRKEDEIDNPVNLDSIKWIFNDSVENRTSQKLIDFAAKNNGAVFLDEMGFRQFAIGFSIEEIPDNVTDILITNHEDYDDCGFLEYYGESLLYVENGKIVYNKYDVCDVDWSRRSK